MTGKGVPDRWQSGEPYERYVGRWSRRVAPLFLDWLGMPAGLTWLDVGCGTGAVIAAVLTYCHPQRVIGVEPSDGFRLTAQQRIGDGAVLHAGNASAIPVDDHSIDVLVSGFVLNFIPELPDALQHMASKLKPGGTLAAYVWDYAEGMLMMRHFWDAASELDPAAAALDEGRRFKLCQHGELAAAFERAGLSAVATAPLTIIQKFDGFDDYWQPFLGGQGSAPSYFSTLDAASQRALSERLRQRLPFASDGTLELSARAWAVRGLAH